MRITVILFSNTVQTKETDDLVTHFQCSSKNEIMTKYNMVVYFGVFVCVCVFAG